MADSTPVETPPEPDETGLVPVPLVPVDPDGLHGVTGATTADEDEDERP